MKRVVGLLGIALMCSLALGARKSHLVTGGIIHYRASRFAKADSLFVESIKKNLAVTEAQLWHGKTRVRMEDYVEAGKAFLKVLEADPGGEIIKMDEEGTQPAKIAFYYGAKDLIRKDSMPELLVTFLRKAIDLLPDEDINYITLGFFYLDEDSLDAAFALANELNAIDSLSPDAPYMMGRVLHAEAQALDSADLRSARYAQTIDNYYLSTARYNNQLNELKAKIAKNLSLDTNAIPGLLAILDSLEQTGTTDDPVTIEDKETLLKEEVDFNQQQTRMFLNWLKRYLGKGTQIANVYYYIGRAYLETEKNAQADSAFNEALNFNPDNVDALWDKSVAAYRQRNFVEGVEGFLKYAELIEGEDYLLEIYLGLCYLGFAKPNFEEAEKHLLAAKEMDPENPEPYRYMAGLYDKKSEFDKSNTDKWVKKSNEWYDIYKEKLKAQNQGGSQ